MNENKTTDDNNKYKVRDYILELVENDLKGYPEKTLVSDILREIIDLGFGKSKKIIKINELKKIKSNMDLNKIYSLTFYENEDKTNNDDNV